MPVLGVLLLALIAAPPARAAELPATTSTFASVFAGAQAGDTVLLATGSYGTFRGAIKPGMVTVKPAAGATASMSLDFNPAANITLDGLRIVDADFADARTKDITVRNSDVTGQVTFRTGQLANSNILLDNNVHRDWNACGGCGPEGRIWLPESTSQPSGITISNSEFYGGLSDGIQNGSNGTRIIGNEFHHLLSGSAGGVHADAIQLYGSRNTVIRGNWFHDLPDGVGIVMAADGADHELFEHNVFGPGNRRPYTITLWSDDGSAIRHNTFVDGACEFNLRCGLVDLGAKSADDAGRGTVVTDNVLGGVACCGDKGATWSGNHNLVRDPSGIKGAADLRGLPTYVGPASAFAGFALAAGSAGSGNASDGTDRGAGFTGGDPAPSPFPGPPPPSPSPSAAPVSTSPSRAPEAAASATPAARGPVAAYNFDEAGGPVVGDSSGHGNDGRLRGAKRTRTARAGRALAFDGRRGGVTVSHSRSLRLRGGMTLEAWLRPTAGRGRWHSVLRKQGPAGAAYAMYASDPAGRPVATAGAARARATDAGSALALRAWSHLAVTYDGRALRVYVNGALVASRVRSGLLPGGRGPLRIGDRSFRGQIDDVRIYDRALDAAAIAHDMRAPV